MIGLIWFVQIVHYPLFAMVSDQSFTRYEQTHQLRTTFIVMPVMLLELFTALLLVWNPPQQIPVYYSWLGLFLLMLVWGSTFFLQVPRHNALSVQFNPDDHWALVTTNWIRTFAWSLRGLLLMIVVFKLLPDV